MTSFSSPLIYNIRKAILSLYYTAYTRSTSLLLVQALQTFEFQLHLLKKTLAPSKHETAANDLKPTNRSFIFNIALIIGRLVRALLFRLSRPSRMQG